MGSEVDVINSPWDGGVRSASLIRPGGDVTLVEGQTFCISDAAGDMVPHHPHGLFFLDTRFLSRFEQRINGKVLEAVGSDCPSPFTATIATRVLPEEHAASDIVVFRQRHIGRGMRERLRITNFELEPVDLEIELMCGVDFADLFAVKDNRVRRDPVPLRPLDGGFGAVFVDETDSDAREGEGAKRTSIVFSKAPDDLSPDGRALWTWSLGPGRSWELCTEVDLEIDGTRIEPRFNCDPAIDDGQSDPAEQLASWHARLPEVKSSHGELERSVRRSADDLGALRIFDPDHPEVPIIAAGAPWFMTVFGRDSLLTGWMTLLADSSLARGVLETLARFQGADVNPASEEEPGKILHEMRYSATNGIGLSSSESYFGSVDATPLFVMLLGEFRRWQLADDLVERLLPHADRALEWIERFGDRDGDGYVEYQRQSAGGLANQGWKDSWDAIRFRDSTLAKGPIALCEVQGYVYAAYLARAYFAQEAGDEVTFGRFTERAATLRRRFNEDFWLEEEGTFALGLDGDKRPIDSVASNVGHCLWTGIVDPERASLVADRLLRDDMYSGWGVRTLASSMAAYNPVSYHNGSVWPHDNALCVAGLVRYGFVEHAHRLIEGQFGAAEAHGDRLPELFAGFSREELAVPGSYPSACSPQAWAAAAPLMWLRSLLRFDPAAPDGKVWVAPVLPESIKRLSVHGVVVGDARVDIDVLDDRFEVSTTSDTLQVIEEPRPPLAKAFDLPVPQLPGGSV